MGGEVCTAFIFEVSSGCCIPCLPQLPVEKSEEGLVLAQVQLNKCAITVNLEATSLSDLSV